MNIVLASKNKGKILEITELLKKLDKNISVQGLDQFPEIGNIPEPGSTFLENALHKAKTVAEKTQAICLADDSGLEVDALNGAPGVYSARFSGQEATDDKNNLKLLTLLKEIPEEKRTARFKCIIVAYAPNGQYLVSQGTWPGKIAEKPRGNNGFGYDPVFIDPDYQMTAAEMSQQLKNSLSHRSKALHDFMVKWPDFIKDL